EDLRGRERGLRAVEAAGGEQDAGIGQLEEVGAEEPPRGAGRVDGLERARDRVVDLGARHQLPAARAAGNQHLAVVEELHAQMTRPSGRSVAVWSWRATASALGAGENVRVVGS